MKRVLWIVPVLGMFLGEATPANADLLPIVNAGFESPPTTTFNAGPITGWTISGSGAGVWNINNDPLGFWNVHAPEGNQIAFVSPSDNPGPAAISQTLADTLQANTVYTLSAEVGQPNGFTPTFTIELLAGSNVLASFSGTGPQGSFQKYQVSFDSAGSPFLGESLGIRLESSQAQTGFDEVTLNATSATAAVPEPSSRTMVLSLGALGLLGYAWRRKGRNDRPADRGIPTGAWT